jgi:pyruvate dehydrogenase E1 component alpha subunit
MPGVTVDGNDVIKVYEATSKAVERARKGEGPTLIDSITYRWDGHYVGDPAVARPEGELEEWMKKCPIKKLEKKLRKDGALDEAKIKKIQKKIDDEIEEAVEFGKQSPYPPLEDLYKNVYA